MTLDEEPRKVFTSGWNLSAKLCDSCKSVPSLIFCRADSAYLCIACDGNIHNANKLASRHERVWMCDVCEQAPATVTCKADAAALCVTCDRDIHSANPLSRRHERFPVVPFYESAATAMKSNAVNLLVPDGLDEDEDRPDCGGEIENDDEEAEAASWLLPNPNQSQKLIESPEMKASDYFFSDVDPYLDLDYGSRFQNGVGADSVVPDPHAAAAAPAAPDPAPAPAPVVTPNSFNLDFSKPESYTFTAPSLSQSVSSSSMEVGVVPDGTDISNPFVNGTGGVPSQACQLTGLDREARVLRYREKRKNRKFEKTIRYASRKAYAETRPRIKGRFAKRTELETEVDRLYSAASLMVDTGGYGVVPSF